MSRHAVPARSPPRPPAAWTSTTATPPSASRVRKTSARACATGPSRAARRSRSPRAPRARASQRWSTPDCPGAGPCTIKLDNPVTSIVALFSPLTLGVRLSSSSGTVTSNPAGITCSVDGDPGCEHGFAANTRVQLTVTGGDFKGWNGPCAPADSRTCTIVVDDQKTWAGARTPSCSCGDDDTCSSSSRRRDHTAGARSGPRRRWRCGSRCYLAGSSLRQSDADAKPRRRGLGRRLHTGAADVQAEGDGHDVDERRRSLAARPTTSA